MLFDKAIHQPSTMKFMWKEFDTKLLDNIRKMIENPALEIWAGFGAFYNIYRTSEYFCSSLKIFFPSKIEFYHIIAK